MYATADVKTVTLSVTTATYTPEKDDLIDLSE